MFSTWHSYMYQWSGCICTHSLMEAFDQAPSACIALVRRRYTRSSSGRSAATVTNHEQGGVENVQYTTNHKRKGGGSARAVRSARSASHLEPGLFLAIFLPGIDFVVVQHLIRCLYHKLEKRQQPIVRLIGRSTSLVFGIVSLDFLAVQVSVQFCIRSSSSCSSSWWLIVVRLACRQFSGSGEAMGGSGGLCVLSTVTMLHESHPSRWMQLDAKSVGPP